MRSRIFEAMPTTALLVLMALPTTIVSQEPDDRPKQPEIVTFDVPGAGTTPSTSGACGNGLLTACFGTTPMANNDAGEIVGIYVTDSGVYHGFLLSPKGKVTVLDEPNADTNAGDFNGTYPFSINSRGEVTGFYQNQSEVLHGFLRDHHGTYIEVDDPNAGTDAFQGTWPTAINDKGEIVGFYFDGDNGTHGFVRSCDGKYTTVDDPNGSGGTFVALEQGLNAKGAVVGWYFAGGIQFGFVGEPDGTFHTIEPLSSASFTLVGGINDGGVITGYFGYSNGFFSGYSRKADGRTTISNVAGPDGVQGTAAFTLNAQEEITGVAVDAIGANHGFVRFNDGTIKTFDADKSGGMNFQGTRPTTINNSGQVIGFVLDGNNVSHGFVRSPDQRNQDEN